MDVLAVVALATAAVGVVVGGLAWRDARDAKALAADATRTAAELAQRAAAADGTAAAAAPAMPAVPPVLIPPATSESGDERSATIAVRPGGTPGQELPTNQGSGSGLIGVFIVNGGPAVAHDLRLSATFPNGTVRASDRHGALSAHKELTLFTQVIPQDFGPGNSVDVVYRVAYRDGNGEHELAQRVRVEGGWAGRWKTYLDGDGNDLIAAIDAGPTEGRDRALERSPRLPPTGSG
jgi:hypothetical protein